MNATAWSQAIPLEHSRARRAPTTIQMRREGESGNP